LSNPVFQGDPGRCAAFIIIAFTLAGLAQTWWFKSPLSARWAVPLDGGRTLRGRRWFGPNKTWKGFVVMVPAAASIFALLGSVAGALPAMGAGLWQLSPMGWAGLGSAAGFGFMAAELPNSFIKRQLGVEAGEAPQGRTTRWIAFLGDRLDSIIGMLVAITLAVPTPWQVWILVLSIGPGVHWLFSVVLYALGVKARPA
jgi:CDP-diglyceride synthetase